MSEIDERIEALGIVPVIKLEEAQQAIPLAKALQEGMLPIAEITFRSAAAPEAIRLLAAEMPDLLVGAGTVTSVDMARQAIDAGARFIVSPGYSCAIVSYCQQHAIPVYPGVNNSSQIQMAMEQGLSVLKFFPAEASGGVGMLDAFSGPFPSIRFIPTGGIGTHNLDSYLSRPSVLACGGSWMVKADLIHKGQWEQISRLCREAVAIMHGFSFAHMGINGASEHEAKEICDMLSHFFLPITEGTNSFFASEYIEVTKRLFPGAHGHIGIRTWNIERALHYLNRYGFHGIASTEKRDAKGRLTVVYLDREIGRFAVHLVRSTFGT